MLDNQLKENMFQAFYLGRLQSRNGIYTSLHFLDKNKTRRGTCITGPRTDEKTA